MIKKQGTSNMKSCDYCYWFRVHSWHVGTAIPVQLKSTAMNRGCTYGWEKRVELDLPKMELKMERVIIEGDMINKPVCSGWKDCGAYEAGVKKGSVVGIDSDKVKYKQWLDEQGIPYEE